MLEPLAFDPLLLEPVALAIPLLLAAPLPLYPLLLLPEPSLFQPPLFEPLLPPVLEGLPPFVTELVTTTKDGVAHAEHQTVVVVKPVGMPVGFFVHPELHVAVMVTAFVVRPVGQTSIMEVIITVVVGMVVFVV